MIESVVLRNTATGQQISINKTEGEYWLDEIDLGTVDGSGNTFKFIDQIGETLVSTSILTRNISISGWVASEDESLVKAQKAVLNRFINPRTPLELVVGKYRLTFSPSTSVRYAVKKSLHNEVMCKFLITGTAYDPMFASEEAKVEVAYVERRLVFPLMAPPEKLVMGVHQPTLIARINNAGAIPTGYKIEFIAYGGPVENPKVFDIGSQQFIRINKTLANGERVLINTRDGERKVEGFMNATAEGQNYFHYRDLSSSWLELALDENLLRYSADSGEKFLVVNVYYSQRYLEVDE